MRSGEIHTARAFMVVAILFGAFVITGESPDSEVKGVSTQMGAPVVSIHWPIVADYDADGRDDLALFSPIDRSWMVNSTLSDAGLVLPTDFSSLPDIDDEGLSEHNSFDKEFTIPDSMMVPPADYYGDGARRRVAYRPGDGTWHFEDIRLNVYEGVKNAFPLTGDLDGDDRADLVLYDAENSRYYYSLLSGSNDYYIGPIEVAIPFVFSRDYSIRIPNEDIVISGIERRSGHNGIEASISADGKFYRLFLGAGESIVVAEGVVMTLEDLTAEGGWLITQVPDISH